MADEEYSDEGDMSEMTDQSFMIPTVEVTRSGSGRSGRTIREGTPDESVRDIERPTSPIENVPPLATTGSTLSRAFGSIGSLTRRGWGEAPTYLEAMSSPDPRQLEAQVGVPPPRNSPQRGGTIRNLLSRAGGSLRLSNQQRQMTERPGSVTSLLLQPQTSRLSTITGASGQYSSPWSSTASLMNISSPIPNTAVRASFEMPRAGLSDDQMRYISTPAAVNLVGVKLGDPPIGRRRSRSVATQESAELESREQVPPPSWEEVDGERRRIEAETRRGLAKPVNHGAEMNRESNGEASSSGEVSATPSVPPTSEVPIQGETLAMSTLSIPAVAPTVEVEPPTPVATTFSGVATNQ